MWAIYGILALAVAGFAYVATEGNGQSLEDLAQDQYQLGYSTGRTIQHEDSCRTLATGFLDPTSWEAGCLDAFHSLPKQGP